MNGALLSWGCRGSSVAELVRLCRRHRISRVTDVRPGGERQTGFGKDDLRKTLRRAGVAYERRHDLGPTVDPKAAGQLYAFARAGERILVVGSDPDPDRCHRGRLLSAIAADQVRYASSVMNRIITPIELWNLVDGNLSRVEVRS